MFYTRGESAANLREELGETSSDDSFHKEVIFSSPDKCTESYYIIPLKSALALAWASHF